MPDALTRIAAALASTCLVAATPPASGPAPAPTTKDPTPALERDAARPERTMPVDPVLLMQGKEVPGKRELAEEFEGTVYLFASEETQKTFDADRAHFAAADGGACGRMGPLGGLGDARRYAIEQGMLFFFASDGCREQFRKTPFRYMEPLDTMPNASVEDQAAGLAAVDRWVAWAGGKAAVKAAGSYSQTTTQRVQSGGADWDLTQVIEIDGPHTMRRTDTWRKVGSRATRRTETIVTPDAAATATDGGHVTPLARSRRVAFERSLQRLPYAILRARYRPEAGFLAAKTGEGKIGGADCDFVVTWFDGNRTYLAIERATGRLAQQGYVGRDSDSTITPMTLDAVADAGIDALRLPTQWIVSRTGEKEGTKGPVATITVGPSRVPDPAPAAPASRPAQRPAPAGPPATPAPR